MNTVLAIDPGPVDSGWAEVDIYTLRPLRHGKTPNEDLRLMLLSERQLAEDYAVAIEMVASYGMAVGKEVFQTCVWIGRFLEATWDRVDAPHPDLVYRRDVKLHHCGQSKAKDANIRQALVDRFAPGQPNHGKGTKAEPGWFHGFRADVWQAYALAVLAADRMHERPGVAS